MRTEPSAPSSGGMTGRGRWAGNARMGPPPPFQAVSAQAQHLPALSHILSGREWDKRRKLKTRRSLPCHFLLPPQAPAPKTSGGGEDEWGPCSHRQTLGWGPSAMAVWEPGGQHAKDAGDLGIGLAPSGAQRTPLIQPRLLRRACNWLQLLPHSWPAAWRLDWHLKQLTW